MKLPALTKRPAHTFLFITEIKTFRVDADRKGLLITELETIERGCEEPARLARTLLKIHEESLPFGRKLWLLFLRLPSFLLNLPSMQVQGVDDDTLMQALQFEMEGITGQSSQDSCIAFQFIKNADEMSDYWVSQIDQLALNDLLKAVKKCKTTLGGLLHPGGLPLALSDSEAAEWLRFEAWSNQLFALQQTEEIMNMQVFSFDTPHWRSELDQWLNDNDAAVNSETLLNNKLEVLPDTERQYRLNENHDLTLWLGLWAQTLIKSKKVSAPILRPPSNFNPNIAWMVGTGGGALVLCALHASWFISQSHYYETESNKLKQIDSAMQTLRKQVNSNRDEKTKLKNKIKKLKDEADLIPKALKTLQQRPAKLLLALANGRSDELVVETLTSKNNTLVITGVTLVPRLANELSTYLQDNLPDLNWEVQTPTKKDMRLFDEGGPWSFELMIVDTGIPGFNGNKKP